MAGAGAAAVVGVADGSSGVAAAGGVAACGGTAGGGGTAMAPTPVGTAAGSCGRCEDGETSATPRRAELMVRAAEAPAVGARLGGGTSEAEEGALGRGSARAPSGDDLARPVLLGAGSSLRASARGVVVRRPSATDGTVVCCRAASLAAVAADELARGSLSAGTRGAAAAVGAAAGAAATPDAPTGGAAAVAASKGPDLAVAGTPVATMSASGSARGVNARRVSWPMSDVIASVRALISVLISCCNLRPPLASISFRAMGCSLPDRPLIAEPPSLAAWLTLSAFATGTAGRSSAAL